MSFPSPEPLLELACAMLTAHTYKLRVEGIRAWCNDGKMAKKSEQGRVKMRTKAVERVTALPGMRVSEGYTVHPFDVEYEVRTSGLIPGRHLEEWGKVGGEITAYFGVAPSVFRRLLAVWKKTLVGVKAEEFAFVDVGAGMGRGMLLADEINCFREVVGVELNPLLARVARKNLERWRKAGRAGDAGRLRLEEGDATSFVLPEGPVALFLFNPFGAGVMKRFLKSVERQIAKRKAGGERGARADLLYVNDEQRGVLDVRKGWGRVFEGSVARSKSDELADAHIMDSQPEGEYMSGRTEACSVWRWM